MSATLHPSGPIAGPADEIVHAQCAASLALVTAAAAGVRSALTIRPGTAAPYDWALEDDCPPHGLTRPDVLIDETPDDRADTRDRGWVR